MSLLEALSKRHKDWIQMALSFGLPIEDAEDLVQEMYVRMYERTTLDKIRYKKLDVNTFYVYVTLKNLFYDQKRSEVGTVQIDPQMIAYEDAGRCKHLKEEILEEIAETIERLHWYDKKIFEIYYGEKETIRQLSEGSKISQSSIYNTLKNVRIKIKENHKEKYEEYKCS